ncbi:MAG TPA: AAA family ATPase [Candidatus Dormibacteraeota bacterium]|nr:AAA family ATPase [Candidatus Dormibacteraeota bacterium]
MRPGTGGSRPVTIRIPPAALVMLVGAAASGKSTFAARHLGVESVVSSDGLRQALAGTESDQWPNAAVFDRLQEWVDARLAAGVLAVVDATNTDWMWRAELLRRARLKGRSAIAIVFNLPLDVCLARNATRSRKVPVSVIRRQVDELRRDVDRLDLEGFTAIYVLGSVVEVDAVSLQIEKGPMAPALPS